MGEPHWGGRAICVKIRRGVRARCRTFYRSHRMKSVSWTLRLAVGSVVLGLGVTAGAEEAPKTLPAPPAGIEATKVKVPLCTTETEFLKVPAGKVTIKDAEGKEQ